MSDLREDIIDAATSHVKGNAEIRMAARRQVEMLLLETGGPPDAEGRKMLRRWEMVDQSPPGWKRMAAFWAVVTIAMLAALWFNGKDYLWYKRNIYGWGFSESLREEARAAYQKRGLTREQLLLLFGEPPEDFSDGFPGRKTLWELHPDDPACYAEYVVKLRMESNKVPSDFRDTVARIDPGNSFFTYLEAAALAKGTIRTNSLGYAAKKAGKTPTWTILDEKRLDEALELSSLAKEQTRFESYAGEMASRRLKLLRQEGGLREYAYRTISLIYGRSGISPFLALGDAYAAKAQALADRGDSEAFLKLLTSMEAFTGACNRSTESMLDGLLTRSVALKTYPAFARGAVKLGLGQEAARLELVSKNLTDKENEWKARADPTVFNGRGHTTTRYFDFMHRRTASPPPVTTEDLAPGRYHEHALASRFLAVLTSAALAIGIGLTALGRQVTSRVVRGLAGRVAALAGPSDYLWVIVLGVVFPVLSVAALSRLTPLGGREFSVEEGAKWLLPAGDFLGMFLLVTGSSVLAAGWRIRKRATAMNLGRGVPWAALIIILCALTGILTTGWVVTRQYWKEPQAWYLAGLPFLIPLLMVLCMPFQALWGPTGKRLQGTAVAAVVMPVLGWAMLLMVALGPLLRMEEDHWFARFDFIQPDAEFAPWTRYEGQVAASVRQETREILEAKP